MWHIAVPAGWAASTGQDFTANHAIKTIDYGGFHIWPGEAGGSRGLLLLLLLLGHLLLGCMRYGMWRG